MAGKAGHQLLVLEDEDEEVDELVVQAGHATGSLKSAKDSYLDSPSNSDGGLVADDLPLYKRL